MIRVFEIIFTMDDLEYQLQNLESDEEVEILSVLGGSLYREDPAGDLYSCQVITREN